MFSTRAAGRRVTLVAIFPQAEEAIINDFPNYGVRRIWAAVKADPGLADVESQLVEARANEVDALLARVEATAPDVVGLSAFIWSFPQLVELARQLKQVRPSVTIVMGGPAARAPMFQLAPYRDAAGFIDALVVGDGEITFRELVALHDRSRDSLRKIAGLQVPGLGGFVATASRPSVANIDEVVSPYQQGLMPGGFGYLECYKGCPLSCSYCEWGSMENARRVLSTEYLVREFSAMDRAGVNAILMVDAGLNLNAHAFRQLKAAAEESGYLRRTAFICEVYPAAMTEEHLSFLLATGHAEVGVGLQSMDKEVLSRLDRPFDDQKFEAVVTDMARHLPITIEIILGLPGDNARSFRSTFDRVRRLPCNLRVYHCVVLPSGLMTRARSDSALAFDPQTLKMESCQGWSAAELRSEVEFLNRLAEKEQGATAGGFLWSFKRIGSTERQRRSA